MLTPAHHLDLVSGRFARTSREDVEQLFRALAQRQDDTHLVVHFHGGLVSRASAHEAAADLLPAYAETGAYPVFFVWNSDAWTTVSANLQSIVQERAFRRLVLRVAQMALGALFEFRGGRGSGAGLTMPGLKELPESPEELDAYLSAQSQSLPFHPEPLTPAQETWVKKELSKDPVLQHEQAAIAAAAGATSSGGRGAAAGVAPLRSRMSPAVRTEIVEESSTEDAKAAGLYWTLARYGAQILKEVITRYMAGRHHGLYDTVVQETLRAVYLDNLGIIAWNTMKDDTGRAFEEDGAQCGGTAFLDELRKVWGTKVRRLTLIGHSTGAIYIGQFLEHADRILSKDFECEVILLAPACTFRFVHERLNLFQRRVRHLRLFGLKDERERSYWEVPGLFRGSLLYIVAGLLEDGEVDMPLLGMQRYYTQQAPFDAPYLQEVVAALGIAPVWAVDEQGPGRNSGALLHGGFDREPRTMASVQHLLRQGFGNGRAP